MDILQIFIVVGVYSPCTYRANQDLRSHILVTEAWNEFVSALDRKMIIMAPFCGEIVCEDAIKKNSARYTHWLSGCG